MFLVCLLGVCCAAYNIHVQIFRHSAARSHRSPVPRFYSVLDRTHLFRARVHALSKRKAEIWQPAAWAECFIRRTQAGILMNAEAAKCALTKAWLRSFVTPWTLMLRQVGKYRIRRGVLFQLWSQRIFMRAENGLCRTTEIIMEDLPPPSYTLIRAKRTA